MSGFYNISQALIDEFTAGSFGLDVAYENANFEPTPGTPWAALFVLAAQPVPETNGVGGLDGNDGIFQIDLNYPLNAGSFDVMKMADTVASFMYNSKRISFGGQQVILGTAGRSQGTPVNGWFRVSLTIEWSANVLRRTA